MTKVMHENSLFTWRMNVAPELNNRQQQVLDAFNDGGEYTDEAVSIKLGIPLQSVTGRIGELLKKELLRQLSKEETKIRGRRVCVRN